MALPTGPTVTFLFTDIEGSTRLERSVGGAAWAAIVARHDALLRSAIEAAGGVVVKTEGDAFFAAFDRPDAALVAAAAAQRALAAADWPKGVSILVRMGLHLGEGRLRTAADGSPLDDYVGIDVNYAARIAAAGNGGQIVLSEALIRALPAELGSIGGPGADGGLGDINVVDEGLRTVKDFEEPSRLHRIVVRGAADDARPLRTLDAPTNLPGEVTTLVGRDAAIEELSAILGEARILTLTGPGGTGKTRLALGLARAVRDRFPHGTWFVDLAAVGDPGFIEPAIAAALGVRESVDQAAPAALAAFLREKTALLVLDNLEQLLPVGAGVVAALVRAAPALRVVVTSRELLRIAGERGHAVPPLEAAAGVALFIERARAHRPDLALGDDASAAIDEICRRLGGLPLAIELAAARTRILSPAAILDRLGASLDLGGGPRDLPERQRTLRGAVAWSYDLLPPAERRLFERLGAFAGGWTVEAATAVADPVGDLGTDVLDGLEALADKSLVRLESLPAPSGADLGVRFSFHPLLREFALERLEVSGEATATAERFAAVCADLAEVSGAAILDATGEANLARLDREDRNLHAAVERAITDGRADVGIRIVGSIWRWFQQRGRLREGRALLDRLLALPATGDPRVRIVGLAAAGGLAYWMNDISGAAVAYEDRLAAAEMLHDPVLIAEAEYDLGYISMIAGDERTLRRREERALELFTAAGDEAGAVRARQALALAEFLAGDYRRARDLELESLTQFEHSGSPMQVADSRTFLSAALWRSGDIPAAWANLRATLTTFVEIDASPGIVPALGMMAIILLAEGEPEAGARLAGAVDALMREKSLMLPPVDVLHLPDPRSTAVELLGPERAVALLAEGAAIPLADVVASTLGLPAPPSIDAPAGPRLD